MSKSRKLTAKYTLQQFMYWSAYSATITYAVTYLLSKGFSTSQIGLITFLASLISSIFQPIIASYADKAEKNIINKAMCIQSALASIGYIYIYFFKPSPIVLAVVFLVSNAVFDMEQSLLNSESVYYSSRKWSINYGFGRGIGALGFAIASLALGKIINLTGTDFVLLFAPTLLVVQILFTLSFPKDNSKLEGKTNEVKPLSLMQFVGHYRWYSFSLVGIMFLAMVHLMLENYLIKFITALGGNSSNQGIGLFISTLVETPILVFYSKIYKKLGSTRLLIFAGISFMIKVTFFYTAKSVIGIYMGQFMQISSYSFIAPTQVYYAEECIPHSDMVKGQSLSVSMFALGCAFGNLIGGILIGARGIKFMLTCTMAFAVLGTLILFFTIPRAKSANKPLL